MPSNFHVISAEQCTECKGSGEIEIEGFGEKVRCHECKGNGYCILNDTQKLNHDVQESVVANQSLG